jgi:hypothetical protein
MFWFYNKRIGLALAFLGHQLPQSHANAQVGSIFLGVDAVAILLFFPETSYHRKYIAGVGQLNLGIENFGGRGDGKVVPADVQEQPTPPKKSFLQELQPWSQINRNTNLFQLFFRPLPIIVYPATIFSFLTFASTLGWLLCFINTNASVFQAPPYNMTPAINGLINISGVIGNLLGAYAGGALTDKWVERQARRNNGLFEPETRLVALIIPFIVVPAGLLMYNPLTTHLTSGMGSEFNITHRG